MLYELRAVSNVKVADALPASLKSVQKVSVQFTARYYQYHVTPTCGLSFRGLSLCCCVWTVGVCTHVMLVVLVVDVLSYWGRELELNQQSLLIRQRQYVLLFNCTVLLIVSDLLLQSEFTFLKAGSVEG